MCAIPIIKLTLYGKQGLGKFALVDGDYDGEYLSQYRWKLGLNGYAYTMLYQRKKEGGDGRKHLLYLHQMAAGSPPPGFQVDHKNRDKLDCRSCNLRWVTPKENTLNRGQSYRHNKSGFRGVSQVSINRWSAICKKEKLGLYSTPEQAARVYDKAALLHWGADAALNFM